MTPSAASPPSDIAVFDRDLVRRHRERAAARLEAHDFLFRAAADLLGDRLLDVARPIETALDLGCHGGELGPSLAARGVGRVVHADLAWGMAARARAGGGAVVVADEEWLPFRAAAFDLVISNLSLHWVNDLPGALIQARQVLRPDGLFLASILGAGTLAELRTVLLDAEAETAGGAAPRVSPFADVRDAGGLLQRAGFALPVVDRDILTVAYEDAFALMADLRGMGETNALHERHRGFMRRDTLMRAAELYRERFGRPDGRIPASFEIVTLTAWAPHASQPQPLRPGSASTRLAHALDAEEQSAGERADPGRRSKP